MPKKYITVQLEVEYFPDNDNGETEMSGDNIESVYPVSAYLHNLTLEDIKAVHHHLRYDDDAYFDLGWELKALLSKALPDEEA